MNDAECSRTMGARPQGHFGSVFRMALAAVLCAGAAQAAAPVVSNVRASQRSGTGLVDIWYDCADADGNTLGVTVQISNNGGTTWRNESSLSGDLGLGIAPGSNKHVIWDAGADWDPVYFPSVRVKIIADDGYATAPPEMKYIPEGNFDMGDIYAEGGTDERPVHTVYISGFYMDKFEVTKALWDEVWTWALTHGYVISDGAASGASHPVHTLSWYDAVKWCNARSEMRGLAPLYHTDTTQTNVYRTGNVNIAWNMVKWTGNGYRLPTEAEWEKAARGGLVGHHYPWPSLGGVYGSHINGGKANYYGSGDPYDNGTTPVGYYNGSQTPSGGDIANGYGLYDMAGNIWEWCWDWYDSSWYGNAGAIQSNTRGPASGTYRALRGGSWNDGADDLRCAERDYLTPSYAYYGIGFRCVRGL